MLQLNLEREQGYPNAILCGVDEVGRGCLAGPVVAAAVVLPPILNLEKTPWLKRVTDSKKLSAKVREELSGEIHSWARAVCIAPASVEEIDELNIYHATLLAMKRAVAGLSVKPDWVLVDGNALPRNWEQKASAIVKGDSRALSIACASIVAKVFRDQLMQELDLKNPGYGLGVHKGYPTAQHLEALKSHGVLGIHRKSFGPVRELLA